MTRKDTKDTYSLAIKLCIWSIRNQTWLAGQLRIYICAATAVIALLALADVISIQTAILSVFCGGAIVVATIWTLIQHRKTILLNIRDPEIRAMVHNTMVEYLHRTNHSMPTNSGWPLER